MPNKNYSRNAEEKLKVVKYAEKHGNAATAKHYDTDESNIRYWRKQKLSHSGLCELILKAWIEISADTIINGLWKPASLRKVLLLRLQPKMN